MKPFEFTSATTFRSAIAATFSTAGAIAEGWQINEVFDGRCGWINVFKNGFQPQRSQGWKLHVSATPHSAVALLEVILEALKYHNLAFKVVRSPSDLFFLNSGKGGLSQVGKFVTIYPADDDQLVELAIKLDSLTDGLEGPSVPSDRPLRSHSLIHYRYGTFTNTVYQNSLGQLLPFIRDPHGNRVQDLRTTALVVPEWVSDPLVTAGLLPPFVPKNPLLRGRYLCVTTLYRTAKGRVIQAIDIESDDTRPCIIKQAYRYCYLDADTRCAARDLLLNEQRILQQVLLQGCRYCPQVYDSFEEDGDYYLVLEYIDGISLHAYCSRRGRSGLFFTDSETIAFGTALCNALDSLYTKGVLHRDIKPSNIMLTEAGEVRVIDFELAFDHAKPAVNFWWVATRGYCSPRQTEGGFPSIADEVFALGAVLYRAATNLDPSLAPASWEYTRPWLALLNPGISASIQSIIIRCMDPDANARFSSIDEVLEAFANASEALSDPANSTDFDSTKLPHGASKSYLALAELIGEQLCHVAVPVDGGWSWLCRHPNGYGYLHRNLQSGASGIGLFLLDLFDYSRKSSFKDTALGAVQGLLNSKRERDYDLPGLYVGESGVGLFFLRAGQILGDAQLLQESLPVADRVFSMLPESPDLYNGKAGCGLFFVIAGKVTQEPSLLHKAKVIGDKLIACATSSDDGYSWSIPPGYGHLSSQTYYGFAHGAAGIGYFLLELFTVSQSERYLQAATRAANFIVQHRKVALLDGAGINWADTVDNDDPQSLYWCHGAAGIGRFLLRAYQVCRCTDYLQYASQAAMLVAKGGRWLNPVQCHGLSGNLEFLIDLYQVTQERFWLSEATIQATILQKYATDLGDFTTWTSEEPTITTPDFMIGSSGVGESLLRLHAPRNHGYLFSTQYCPRGLEVTSVRCS